MKSLVKNFLSIAIFSLISLTIFVGWWLYHIRFEGNFHKVIDGVYRSGQLFDYNLPEYYEKYKFKTILNLRGESPNSEWYKYEKEFCDKHQIKLINFGIKDNKVIDIDTMKQIVNIIENAEKPILIHCRAGADRTGLATSIYLYYKGIKNADDMLSIRYGHFPYFGSKTKAMDESYKIFKEYMQKDKY